MIRDDQEMPEPGPAGDSDETIFRRVIRYFLDTPPSRHGGRAEVSAYVSEIDGPSLHSQTDKAS